MHISRLYISHFRNLKEQEISLSRGVNLILGKNGQGKTNLLESVYVLSTAKSFRAQKTEELLSWGEEKAAIFGNIVFKESTLDLSVEINKRGKKLLINGNKPDGIYAGNLVTITFVPSDLELIKGGPQERRRFLDKHITDVFPETLKYFVSYQKALEQKLKVLKQDNVTLDTLYPWNRILSANGAKIFQARKKYLTLLEEASNTEYNSLKFPDGVISFSYEAALRDGEGEEAFELKLNEISKREIASQLSLFGVHKDEVKIETSKTNARSYASQGQTRSIVIALKLGALRIFEENKNESPVVLLDDIDSELDSTRKNGLLSHIVNEKRQVLLTSTGGAELESAKEKSKVFYVENGKISEE